MQNLLVAWKFKQMSLSKNFIIRNDIILDVNSKFELSQDRFYKKLFNVFNELVIKLERPQHSQLRTIYGVSASSEYSKACNLILNGMVIDMMNVIIHLTQHNHPVDISRYIRCDVNELPSFTLDIIQFINSHKNVIDFVGTDASIVRFDKTDVQFKFESDVKENRYSIREFPMSVQKLNITCKILGMPMSRININDLFIRHDCILNAYVQDKIDSKKRITATKVLLGNGCNEYDAQVALFLKTSYLFSDMSCIDEYSTTILPDDLNSILEIEATEGQTISKYTFNPDVIKSAAEASKCFGINQSQKVEGFGDVSRLSNETDVKSTEVNTKIE